MFPRRDVISFVFVVCLLAAAAPAALAADPPPSTQIAKVVASDIGYADGFGSSVAMDADTLAVGASYANAGVEYVDPGAVYVFERNHGGTDSWGEVKKVTPNDGASGDRFGVAVSLSGDTLVVGAFFADVDGNADQGAAYVFERNRGGADHWGQVGKLIAPDGAGYDYFGISVDIAGDTIVIGAPFGGDTGQGGLYVFGRDQGGEDKWGLVKNIDLMGFSGEQGGVTVAISGDTIVTGAPTSFLNSTMQGVAYVFERNQSGADYWGQVKTLTVTDNDSYDSFGYAVDIAGDTIVVGSRNDDLGAGPEQGSVYVFERNQGGANFWGQMKKLAASDGIEGDQLGYSVALTDDTLVAGAPEHAPGGSASTGAAYLFLRNLGGTNQWGEADKFTATDGQDGDTLGRTVSVAGNTAAAGAVYAEAAYLFTAPWQYPLTVAKSGSGTVTSDPSGISCGADCGEEFSHGTVVTLTATPDPGWTFIGWSGPCMGAGDCIITMDAATAVQADFGESEYKTWLPFMNHDSGIGMP